MYARPRITRYAGQVSYGDLKGFARRPREVGKLGDWGQIVGNILSAGSQIYAAKVTKSAANSARDAQREQNAADLALLEKQAQIAERIKAAQSAPSSAPAFNPLLLAIPLVGIGLSFLLRPRS